MDWHDLSLTNFGLVMAGRRDATEYTPDMFFPPFDKGIKAMLKPRGRREDAAKIVPHSELQAAHDAVSGMNGLGEPENFDWKGELIKASDAYRRGRMFKKTGELLERNEDVDLLPLYGDLTSALAGQSSGLTLASQIDYKHYQPFMKSGYAPIDTIIGGIPSDGPIVIYGLTGVGKSHFAATMVKSGLVEHRKKTAGIYTLEMSSEHYLKREIAMYPDMEKLLDRFYVSGSVRNIEELVAEITTRRLDMVVIDDMDGLCQEESTSEYLRVYKRIREICRFLKIPVFVLAQPNRMAKLGDRFLRPFDISWSGAGEDSAALLIALQRANAMDLDDDIFPLEDDDRYYMIFWKSRDGWPIQQGPGAIRLENGKQGQLWTGTPYKNTLWTPQSRKARKIGNKGRRD